MQHGHYFKKTTSDWDFRGIKNISVKSGYTSKKKVEKLSVCLERVITMFKSKVKVQKVFFLESFYC